MGVTAPDIAQIPMSPELAATLARSAEFAGATGATDVSLEHLLAALCDDPDAMAVLDASHIDGERIKGDVISHVLQGAPQAATPQDSLGVSPEVRRILEAAAAAARGSRRRDINGAIVLAAIVGDAKSIAAEVLEAHGLTFENAIRALQAALSPPREAPVQQPPPVADDVLARARERVQSRSAPSLREIMKDMPRPAPLPPVPMPEVPDAHAPEAEESHTQPPFPPAPPSDVASPEIAGEPGRPPDSAPAAFPRDVDQAPESPRTEPLRPEPRPSPAAVEPPTQPTRPFPGPSAPHEPRLPPGHDGPTPHRSEPTFGTPVGPTPFPQEPSLPLPVRPANRPAPGGPRQEVNPSAPPFPSSTTQSPAPPREIFPDLPPRPQPSRIQPPPIPPSAGPGGPATSRARGPVPTPPQAGPPQFGPHGPSLPQSAAPGPQPGAPMGPAGPRPNLGQEPGFRPGPPATGHTSQSTAQMQRPSKKRSKAAAAETGQLAENIPRSMRVGKTVRAEVRIAKASVKALTEGLDGGGQVWQHAVAVTKAMSVRIRAPDGGFFIESASPETQWIESNLGYASDDFASWRFLITPQARGWSDLQIIVSARTIGADGVAAETALPDQIIEVKVRANIGRALARLFGWTIAAILGGALATFGETGMTIATALLKKFGH
ncbi:MAG: Clp protease [Proteobacteria bacterium]|nr:Clp protease [Pseudomonadota bacterium]